MKKQYISPTLKIVLLDYSDAICTSTTGLKVFNANPTSEDEDDGYYDGGIF